jgi:hypothetical protein
VVFRALNRGKGLEQSLDFQIAQVRCMPEVFDFKELVLWCEDKFNTEKRIIPVGGKDTSLPHTYGF